jgi:hypothetical protein
MPECPLLTLRVDRNADDGTRRALQSAYTTPVNGRREALGLVDEASEDVASPEDPFAVANRDRLRRVKVEAAMGASPGVVIDVLGEDRLQVASAEDLEGVEALSTDSAHPALRGRVRPWGANRGLDGLDADGGEHRVER